MEPRRRGGWAEEREGATRGSQDSLWIRFREMASATGPPYFVSGPVLPTIEGEMSFFRVALVPDALRYCSDIGVVSSKGSTRAELILYLPARSLGCHFNDTPPS